MAVDEYTSKPIVMAVLAAVPDLPALIFYGFKRWVKNLRVVVFGCSPYKFSPRTLYISPFVANLSAHDPSPSAAGLSAALPLIA